MLSMRLFILLCFLAAIDLYSFQALRLLSQSWSATLRISAYILFWSIPVLTLGYFAVYNYFDDAQWNRHVHTYLRTFIFIAYTSKTLILPFLAIDDLRRGIQWIVERFSGQPTFNASRSTFLSRFGILMGSIPLISLTYGMVRNAYRYKVFKTAIEFDDLPENLHGLKIIQISDIHSGSFTFKEPVKEAIDLINAQEPDLVFFTGDLVNNRADEMFPFLDVFDKIKAKHGVFSVLGNHDYGDYEAWDSEEDKIANFALLKDMHRRLGWDLLLNENRVLEVNNARLAVVGVENYSAHLRFPRHGDLAKAVQGTEDAAFKVLLSHDPSHWDVQVNKDFPDIHLMLSGHTHGMQFGVEIPGWLKWSPIKYLYKQWAGLYQQGQQYLYVNRGLGFLGYPGRVGILPEIASLELRKKGFPTI